MIAIWSDAEIASDTAYLMGWIGNLGGNARTCGTEYALLFIFRNDYKDIILIKAKKRRIHKGKRVYCNATNTTINVLAFFWFINKN